LHLVSGLDVPDADIRAMVTQAAGLFVWARTAVDYIATGLSYRRLKQVLEVGLGSHGTALNELYHLVLKAQFSSFEGLERLLFCQIIGTILVAKKPLTLKELTGILVDQSKAQNSITNDDIRSVLNGISVVLSPYSDEHSGIQFSHLSFPEFLWQEKIGGLNPKEAEIYLAGCCMLVLKRELKFNICHLTSSHYSNSHYPMESLIQTYVSPALQYASVYWEAHLLQTSVLSDQLLEEIELFLLYHLLQWLELMSILQLTEKTSQMLQTLVPLLQV
jgi:hypothetical protein